MKKIKKTKTKYLSPFTLCASVICAVLAVFILGGYISLNELTLEVGKKTKELDTLNSENSVLALQIERKNSLGNIEQYATEQLGMVKLEPYQVHIVNLAGEDSVEIVSEPKGEGVFDGVVASFNILLEYLN